MRSIIFLSATAFALAGVAGCQKDDKSMEAALKRIDDRLSSIETKLDKAPVARPGAAAAGQPRNARPPGPDPASVYAVPIDGAPYIGAEHAKITIVEAFEFA